jgi:hypothetical protein
MTQKETADYDFSLRAYPPAGITPAEFEQWVGELYKPHARPVRCG